MNPVHLSSSPLSFRPDLPLFSQERTGLTSSRRRKKESRAESQGQGSSGGGGGRRILTRLLELVM